MIKRPFERRGSEAQIFRSPNFQGTDLTMRKPLNRRLWLVLLSLMALLGAGSASNATAACTYSISPAGRMHGYGTATNSVNVTASSSVCAWTVANTNTWITITSGTAGVGNGTVDYTVAANPSPIARTGVVAIAQQLFTVQQQGVPCTYSISPASRLHGYGAASNSVSVTTSSGCTWTVINTNGWITIISATSSAGDGIVSYTVAANPTMNDRTGVMLIGGESFTVTQRGIPCTYSISPNDRTHGYGAASNFVSVTAPSECRWAVVNTNDWLTIASATDGTGDGIVTYAVAANPSASERMGVVMIADQPFSVIQRAAPCLVSISPESRTHGYGATTGSVSVTTAIGCPWTVITTNDWITITSSASGSGSGTVSYMVDANPNPMDRTGVIMIADQLLTLKQRAVVCAYDITPTTRVHGFGETTGTVIVSTSGGCSWTVVNTNTWITILSSTEGMGFGSVGYKVTFNHSTNERSGVIMIADQALSLTQRALTNTGFSFDSITPLGGSQVKLKLLGPINSTCELQWSLDLINWGRIFIVTNTTGAVEYTDTLPGNVTRRFYRALLR